MGKTLIIAEKPSVAGDISRALGKFEKQPDHYENDQYVISSAVGHLLTIAVPEQFGVHKATVEAVMYGRTWSHLTGN